MNNFYVDYISELLKKAGLVEKDNTLDLDYVNSLASQLEKRVGLLIFEQLSTSDLEIYTQMVVEKKTANELANFLEKHIKDWSVKRQKLIEDYAFNFLSRTAKISKAL